MQVYNYLVYTNSTRQGGHGSDPILIGIEPKIFSVTPVTGLHKAMIIMRGCGLNMGVVLAVRSCRYFVIVYFFKFLLLHTYSP